MSKSSSRLGRPGSAGPQNCSLRKDLQGNRSCMLRIGERLMRAGSEGNLLRKPLPAQSRNQSEASGLGQGQNGATKVDVVEDKAPESAGKYCHEDIKSEHQLPKKHPMNNKLLRKPDATCALPGSYAASSRDSDLESLLMQHSEAERKKDVFLNHLGQKFPHHAATILGHQEHTREQLRSSRPPESTTCEGVFAAENMSDGESLTLTVPFSRGCKARSSLPIGRSSSQAKEPVGVLYLQFGDETKQIRMPAEISSEDTLRALFVTAFPQQLTMKKLQSPNMAIYIKDTGRNVYFDLEDIRNITSHSCLKVYHKDPSHVFNCHTRPTNTEGRISKEIFYGSHSPVHRLSSSSRGTFQSLQGSMSPPMVRSMPSSPSRMAYGGRSTQGLVGAVDAGSTALHRDRLSGAGPSSCLCTSSSAILERRDVKPDEDVGSCKSMALVIHGEGGLCYPDSYYSSLQDGGRYPGGRSSFASAQCSGTLSHASEMVDAEVTGIPGGLQQYRASIKPLMGYGDIMEHQTQSLDRQKSRKYGESQIPQLGTLPPSPHRLNEVRMKEGQIIGGVGLVSPERMSPIRRSPRRENDGATVQIINRSRGSGSSSSASSVFADSPLGQPERLIQGHMTAFDAQSERMKAMEEQIASLAGLVHHALSVGGDIPRAKRLASESPWKNHPVPSEPQVNSAVTGGISSASRALQAPTTQRELQRCLAQVKSNVSELRLQLNQLRHLQISHQQTVKSLLHMAGQELALLMCDRLSQSEERTCGRRAEIEEERIRYLATEEKILKQLSELEDYVNNLQSSTVSLPGQLPINLRDVEEGAVNLRRAGESLAILKGEFPELQVKMRSVLRLEMDAVRFLKEEPHKMDYMLKRVKALTEGLSSLRRCVSESNPPFKGAQAERLKVSEADQKHLMTQSPQTSPQPQPRSSVGGPQAIPSSSLTQPKLNYAVSASPATAHGVKTTPATVIQAHRHSPPLNHTHGRDLPTVAKSCVVKVSPRSREGSPALQKRAAPLQSDELRRASVPQTTQGSHTASQVKTPSETAAEPVENADGETPEGSLSQETSSVSKHLPSKHLPSKSSPKNLDEVLQEARASLMKSIPDLDLSDTKGGHSDLAPGEINCSTSKTEMEERLDTLQALLSGTRDQKPAQENDEVDFCQLKPKVEPPLSASPCAKRPQMEKPRRSSVEKKQSPDRSGQSHPPLPRLHAATVGLTTGRTGEVVYSTRREAVGEQGVSEKKTSVNPQPKPLRQPPEVKPKPKPSGTTVAGVSENMEEEEDASNRFLKELQVTQETSSKDKLSGEKILLEGQHEIPQKSRVTGQKPTSAPHLGHTNGCLDNHSITVVPEDVSESRQGPVAPDQKEKGKLVEQGPISNSNSGTPPTTTLQKDNIQSNATAIPGQVDTNVAKEAQTEKSNFTQKTSPKNKNTSEYCKQELAKNKQEASKNSDLCQIQGVKLQLSDKEQCPEEEGSLSPDICDDGGPPPPPAPSDKISHQISKIRVKRKTKHQDLEKRKGFDIAGETTEKPIWQAYENRGFEHHDSWEREPIIIILNEPVDLESDFKRLSTIFEYEEELDQIVSPGGIVEDEEAMQEETDDVKTVSEENTGLHLNISDNGPNSLCNLPQKDGSLDENHDRTKPELVKKANFKFKLPKNKLSAISQAIRSGTTKTGGGTPEVEVVKEEETVTSEQEPVKVPKKHNKDSSRFSSHSTKRNLRKGNKGNPTEIGTSPVGANQIPTPKSLSPGEDVEDLCKRPYQSFAASIEPSLPSESSDGAHFSGKVKQQREGSPSKRSASQILKSPNSPQRKRVKAQPPPNSVTSTTKKQTSSSCIRRAHTRLRHSSPTPGSPEKTTKIQQQASQKQPCQQSLFSIHR
ncbi:sickle tail protein homolog isoform X2 [Phycodurus eques]|uniref:sickle tail protein homolog isoform X2 n=1 Tax=Phycodurus eques TaxID=693459 RepID=UPI002ACF008F|nr:sickle tail protein homolog isoform X2 [Phycodurus eques]